MTNVQQYFNKMSERSKRQFLKYGLLHRLLLYNGISIPKAAEMMDMSIRQCKEICGRRNPFIKHSIGQLINLKSLFKINKHTSDFLKELFELNQINIP